MASNHSAARTSCRIVLKFDTELLWLCGYPAKLASATSDHMEQPESGLASWRLLRADGLPAKFRRPTSSLDVYGIWLQLNTPARQLRVEWDAGGRCARSPPLSPASLPKGADSLSNFAASV